MIIIDSINNGWDTNKSFVVNKIRNSLEAIIFGEDLNVDVNFKEYLEEAKKKIVNME